MNDLTNKIAVVTGGASGIGLALCEELARRRAIVVVADLNGEQATRVARSLVDAGGSASAVAVDVASADSVQALIRGALAAHGRIDLMFNNAGIGWNGDFQEMALAHADRIVSINLQGVLYGASAVYPHMVKQGSGHIINTSSFFSGLIPVPGMSVYSATKHGIVGFSLALREEARMFGVNVSVVCPSFIRSNIDENSARILRGTAEPPAASKGRNAFDATKLARAILKGVSRNTAVIIMPAWVRVFWWLNRASPWLFSVLQYSVIMRRMRRKERSRVGSLLLAPARWLFRSLMGGGKR